VVSRVFFCPALPFATGLACPAYQAAPAHLLGLYLFFPSLVFSFPTAVWGQSDLPLRVSPTRAGHVAAFPATPLTWHLVDSSWARQDRLQRGSAGEQ
jgi:hypothetical protein